MVGTIFLHACWSELPEVSLLLLLCFWSQIRGFLTFWEMFSHGHRVCCGWGAGRVQEKQVLPQCPQLSVWYLELMDWTCILVLSLSPFKYTPKRGFGVIGVIDNSINFMPPCQRSVPALKPYPPEANVPGNARGWGWRDGSMTFCRKGNWWDKVALLSTPLIWSSAGATLIQCMEGQCLTHFEKCSQQGAMLSSWKCAHDLSSSPSLPGRWGEQVSRG